MVSSPFSTALVVAIGVALITAFAEWLHRKRIERIKHLAFGPSGQPRSWTQVTPILAVVATSSIAFGAVVLSMLEPQAIEKKPTLEASKHLLVCLDASPSMFVEDAGPDGKQKRAVWAGEVIQAVLDRIDTETTRVTVFAVYTKSIPVIEETFDMNVVRNMLDGLPLYAAFDAGPTKLTSGVNEALEYARKWKPGSATLLVISDGDSEEKPSVRSIPASIADSIVVGVGDPIRPTMIAGHRSIQDTSSLKSLAQRLRGFYHQGNNKHLPTAVVDRLSMIKPRVTDGVGLREAAIVTIGVGSVILALIMPLLSLLGRSHRELALIHPKKDRPKVETSNSLSGKVATGLNVKGVES